ncbi:MAG: NUDIX domain-containing protein [Pseudonocardia sp.]|nr:NUDIX domain-containing protein [Pseudonocardia sp.]
MTTVDVGAEQPLPQTIRRVHFHDPAAPVPTVVAPSVFVAARNTMGRLLLVRRCDSGTWEFPGGRVDVGESAIAAAVRETWEEAGVRIRVTGLVGLFTDPQHVVRAAGEGVVRQQFVACFHARAVRGRLRPDGRETDDARWFSPADVLRLPMEPGAARWVRCALSGQPIVHLD